MLLLVLLVSDGCDLLLRAVVGSCRSLFVVGGSVAVGSCGGLLRLVVAVIIW